MPILRGRDFTDQDRKGAPYVGIVNQKMADQFWPGKDPIGQHVKHVLAGNRTVEIVGLTPALASRRIQSCICRSINSIRNTLSKLPPG
jgi:hypothetical protein